MTDLFEHAKARAETLRNAGMAQAVNHADRETPQWRDLAFDFLKAFCATHRYFISEDVSGASKEAHLPQPPTDRAWGSVYTRAIKAKLIVQDGTGRSNRRHRSLCPRWRSCTYTGSQQGEDHARQGG